MTIEVPYGTIVRDVIGATANTPKAGNNNTLAITFNSSSSLLANAGDYTFINFTVMAKSQARIPWLSCCSSTTAISVPKGFKQEQNKQITV